MFSIESYLIHKFTAQSSWEKVRRSRGLEPPLTVSNLRGSSPALFLTALRQEWRCPILTVTPTNQAAENLYDDLYFHKVAPLLHLPEWDTLPYDPDEPVIQVTAKIWEFYEQLLDPAGKQKGQDEAHQATPMIVTSAPALLYRQISLSAFARSSLVLEWGESIDVAHLSNRLSGMGYESFALVESRGEFSVRGGIIDIYPPHFEHPVRIDLLGNEIESIRFFDVQTQRTLKQLETPERIMIPPARVRQLRDQLRDEPDALQPFYRLLPQETVFVCLDLPACLEEMKRFQGLVEHHYEEKKRSRPTPDSMNIAAPELLFIGAEDAHQSLVENKAIEISQLPIERHGSASHHVNFHIGAFDDVKPHLEHYLEFLQQKWRAGFTIFIVCDNEGQIKRLQEVLEQKGMDTLPLLSGGRMDLPESFSDLSLLQPIVLCTGDLHNGFVASDCGLVVLTDREIFGRYKRAHVYRKLHKGKAINSLEELKRGDYVVHVEHGIGRFLGLRQQTIDHRTVELLELLYADNNKLLVPTQNIQFVQKYSAIEGIEPSLDRLGSTRWLQRRRKAQEDIERMADELLQLYARREIARAWACPSDTIWQNEFEASFLYEETPDQLKAIADAKRDLERERPSDRLICGDVGFGKTEVAMRAAFKIVQERKQVAVLCPTTILADQHYRTFSERFADYPFKIEVLSRFKTQAEARAILRRLRAGDIDIVIGTHRLLSNDVHFNDLGLLIVDEEQRFGVRHKEKIKNLKTSVHVLTLTATPIPRTMYLAMSGLRDLSVIYTPPPNRLPIKTRIIHWERPLIEEALMRELNRGGQVYFVHNRIHNIVEVVESLQEIVPRARIRYAHGRMNEHELEQVIMDFVNGKFDILVSTTIIENGIDIPNVNTILINRADSFGLAQLYQLRGRVGREAQQAYAYLIVPKGQAITDNAVRRLTAIEEFTELGSGFQIALRDMEIRGTGNILGKEQHGAIAAVGFELYCNLLQETVERLKGGGRDEKPRAEIRWKLDSYLPQDYIPLESQRVGIYKNLAASQTLDDVMDVADDLRDRFGTLPVPAENLILLARLQVLARQADVSEVTHGPLGVIFKTTQPMMAVQSRWQSMRKELSEVQRLEAGQDGAIVLRPVEKLSPRELLRLALKFFEKFVESGSSEPSGHE